MKYSLYAVLLATLLFSCKSKTTETNNDSVTVAAAPLDPTDSLIQKFKPIIQGVWVKSDYIKKVIVTYSPVAAADKAVGITIIRIDTTQIKGDKLVANAGYNNHEGGDVTIKFRPGQTPGTIQIDSSELGYSVENGDTVLVLTEINEAHDKVVTRFIKALNKADEKLGDGMDFLINKSLFSGSYILTDSIGRVRNVTFTDDGKVSGIKGLRTYYAMTDFIVGPMNNLDLLIFNLYAKDQTDYSFKITGETLKLYNTKPTADSAELVVDKLIYTLVRTK
ncbi:MAG: hypothetical protein EOP47_26720 [Sphingobacteriaceae bacterium]|nr:MAG: hypothetical protein EOP47_26720 [Sphingobacteriaceae bacterium]